MTILIAGGHVTPAIALIQSLKKKKPDCRIVYIGQKVNLAADSIEQKEVKAAGAEFKEIISGKIHRFFTYKQFLELIKIPLGLLDGMKLIKNIKPDIVVSFGGYISIPLVIAAKMNKIPILIHEQTVAWGAANNFVKKWADKVAVSWPNLYQKEKTILTGNPLREEILEAKEKKNPSANILYITGGHQGSQIIDGALWPILPQLVQKYVVYHQTQKHDHFHAPNYHAAAWFSGLKHAQIMSNTRISISRAGANTLSELAYLGIPAIVIPLSYAGANEQLKNAQMFAESGLIQIITQNLLSPHLLLDAIINLEKIPFSELQIAGKKASSLIKKDAAEKLADICFQLACLV